MKGFQYKMSKPTTSVVTPQKEEDESLLQSENDEIIDEMFQPCLEQEIYMSNTLFYNWKYSLKNPDNTEVHCKDFFDNFDAKSDVKSKKMNTHRKLKRHSNNKQV